MPAKRHPSKAALALILPAPYPSRRHFPRCRDWIKQVKETNVQVPKEYITEENIRKLWKEDLDRYGLEVRREQIDTEPGLSVMQAWISDARKDDASSLLADIASCKIPHITPENVESMNYYRFVSKLEQNNPTVGFDGIRVEACLWKAIDLSVRQMGGRGRKVQNRMEARACRILSVAAKYWAEREK